MVSLTGNGLFAVGSRLHRVLNQLTDGDRSPWIVAAALTLVCLYGGYFNGGLGILLLAALALFGESNLNAMNGIKSLVSVVLTVISVVVYAAGGLIAWTEALSMMLASAMGAYAGARLIRRLPAPLVRGAVVGVGLLMSVWFFVRG